MTRDEAKQVKKAVDDMVAAKVQLLRVEQELHTLKLRQSEASDLYTQLRGVYVDLMDTLVEPEPPTNA